MRKPSAFSPLERDRALNYLSSLGARCATCRHFVADKLKCAMTGQTQSPHGLCLNHRPPGEANATASERKATA
jgi:hypothetical protein